MKQVKGIHKAQIPNPALNELGKLVGEWKTAGAHPELPGKTFAGQAQFDWIEGGAFLRWYIEVDEEGFPVGIALRPGNGMNLCQLPKSYRVSRLGCSVTLVPTTRYMTDYPGLLTVGRCQGE